MPSSGKRWRHVIINTRSSWLHGDPRDFRSRGGRIQSSGDYKRPPPQGEHAGLFRYRSRISQAEVHIPKSLRAVIGSSLLDFLVDRQHTTLVIAVTKVHAHMLVELPDNIRAVRAIFGEAKQKSSRAVEQALPGSVWARGGTFKPVNSRAHHFNAYDYILYEQGPGAWTWSFKDESSSGRFGRRRSASSG